MTPGRHARRSTCLPFLVLLVCAAAGLVLLSFTLDAPVRSAVLEAQGSAWKKSADYTLWANVSRHGDWPQLMILGGLGLFLAAKIRRRDWVQVIAAAMLASTVSGILANASRVTTGRVRPRDEAKHGAGFFGPWHDGRITIGDSKFNSFPSGHTATAVGFAAPFLFARPALGVVLLLGAGAIAWSRMALGAHHLSDVVASFLLSLAVGWFVLAWVREHGDSCWQHLLARLQAVRHQRQPK